MIKNPVFSLSILIKRFNMSTDYIPDKNIPFDEIEKFNHNGVKVENIEDGNVGLHPTGWTKYDRVVGRNQIPFMREKGTCHEAPKELCC